jgi:mono/diheme cytochrome c family protein
MRDGRFIGYIIAIALGAGLLFGTLRFLGYGVGVSDATELDWSTCEIEAIMTPRTGPLHDIRCDDATIMFESMPGVGGSEGATGSPRQVMQQMEEEDIRELILRSFNLSSWKNANEDLQALHQGKIVNGFVTDELVLIDITKNEGDEEYDHGKGLLSVILNGDRAYVALCVSRTKTRELCEGAIVDLFEARETPIFDQLEAYPEGVVATLDDPPEGEGEAAEPGGEAAGAPRVAIEAPTAEERAALRKRGQEFFMSQCASCHNPGMTRAPSAPKVGDPYWRGALSKDINDVVQAAKKKCKDERDGGPFSHTISDAEISAAAHHAIVKSAM